MNLFKSLKKTNLLTFIRLNSSNVIKSLTETDSPQYKVKMND